MLYFDKYLIYRFIKDRILYKFTEIKWSFIYHFSYNSSNTVIGCIYKHPKNSMTEFAEDYLVPLKR